MGRLGYQSDAQASLAVSYNSLKGYGDSLEDALTRNYPAYEAIGVRGEDGQYRQLATTLLQIENEFYGTIRPKRVIRPGERPLHALRQRGVEYVEVRLMDLNPFEALGIHAQTLRFLDLFLSYCLVSESPSDTPQEIAAIANNQHLVAERGREPGLQLQRGDSTVSLLDWGQEVVLALRPLADQFDAAHGGRNYSDAVDAAMQGFSQPQTLPSARVIESVQREHGGSFAGFVKAQSERTKMEMLESALGPQALARLEQQADESIRALQAIEAADTVPFDAYLQDYLAFRQLLA
jgi:glutamate--cysteine ligase